MTNVDICFAIFGFADICALRDITKAINIGEAKYRETQ